MNGLPTPYSHSSTLPRYQSDYIRCVDIRRNVYSTRSRGGEEAAPVGSRWDILSKERTNESIEMNQWPHLLSASTTTSPRPPHPPYCVSWSLVIILLLLDLVWWYYVQINKSRRKSRNLSRPLTFMTNSSGLIIYRPFVLSASGWVSLDGLAPPIH